MADLREDARTMSDCRDVVFIVDDDQAVRDSLRFIIELDGMDVRICGSCAELLAHPELDTGCCAVIDGKTLSRDGQEILERLETGRDVPPIVLIADHIGQRRFQRAISAGVFRVVDKPLLDDELLRCIRALRRI
jgi:FixJ family two-component response regulator